MDEALATIKQEKRIDSQVRFYSSASLQLSSKNLKSLVITISDSSSDVKNAFIALEEQWKNLEWIDSSEEFHFLVNILWKYALQSRSLLLSRIEELAPVILHLGGENAIRETVKAIEDTAQWWP